MEVLSLYQNDFQYNPRETERSLYVVNHWYNPQVRYAYEDLPHDSPCLRLIAERLIVRRILGIETFDSEYINKVSRVEVFGEGSPIYSELMLPNVFVAMALVPLSPCSDEGRPCLARLYCVGGLATQHKLPLEGMDESSLQGLSWFLEGIPPELREAGIKGRSWLSAAHLLAQIVKRKDKKTARNLAKNFIVTGDVQNGRNICRVEMGRKEELANQKHFNNFKWIIPKENDMNIPKRKIEKPETLEEAYKLIESMRNTATKSFFRFLREGNLEGVKEQYKIGADIYGREEGSDLTCLEVLAEEKAKLYAPNGNKKNNESNSLSKSVDIEKYKESKRNAIKVFSSIEKWLRLNGADAAIMFYLLASNEDEEGIMRNRERYSINACDESGYTAVDIALMADQFEVARLLYKCGGVMNKRCLKTNERLLESIRKLSKSWLNLPGCSRWDNHEKFLLTAIEVGLPLDTEAEVFLHVSGYENDENFYCTLFTAAIVGARDGRNYDIIEACLKRGANVNESMDFWEGDEYGEYGYPVEVVGSSSPWEYLCTHGRLTEELRSKFKNLFVSYGAQISSEA